MRKKLSLLLAVLLLICGFAGALGEEPAQAADAQQDDMSWTESLRGKTVAVQTGTVSGQQAQAVIPDIELAYFNTQTDALAALRSKKADVWCTDDSLFKFMKMDNEDLVSLGYIDTISLGAVFPKTDKGKALRDQYSEFVEKLWTDGTMEEIDGVWFGADEDKRDVLDYEKLPATNGTLRMAVDASVVPFALMKDNRLMGYDVDIAARFCQEYGYGLEVVPMDFSGVLPAVQSGKMDFAATGITITEERAESVLFSSPNYYGGTVIAAIQSGGDQAQAAGAQGGSPSLADLNGKRIGVQTGTISGPMVEARLPGAQVNYFNSQTDALTALKAGKVDAWSTDEAIIRFMRIENPQLVILDEYLAESNLAAVFPKTEAGEKLRDAYSEFVDTLWADGTMEEIDGAWFGADEEKRAVMDYESLPAPNGTLRMAADLSQPPFTYMKDNRIVGYDVDVASRFCEANGYGLEIVSMSFDGMLPAVQSGKVDFADSCITITEERAESVLFSSANYYGGIAAAIWDENALAQAAAPQTAEGQGVFTSLTELDGRRVGVQTGTTFDEIVLETLPQAKISYFNSYPDMAAALEANKIDAFPGDEPVLRLMASEDDKLVVLNEYMDSFDFGFVLPKTEAGEELLSQIDAWLEEIEASGELDEVVTKWTDGAEADKILPDYAGYPAPNGVLTMATEGAYAPMNYYRGDEVVGFEIDLAARFCQANGYGLKVETMNFDGILPAVKAGKADFAAAGITITEERAESVHFSRPYYTGGTVMAVLKDTWAAQTAQAAAPSLPRGEYASLAELDGKRIGVQTGTSFDKAVSELLPNAEIVYLNNKADLVNGLTTHKIDAYTVDEPVIKFQVQESDALTYIPEYMETFDFAYVFPKTDAGQALRDQFSEYLTRIKADGTMAEIDKKWFSVDDSGKTLADYKSFPATNGTLRMATEALYEPFTYILNNEIVGYDIDIAVHFCQEYGYGLEIVDMNFDAVLPAVQTGKCDFGGAGITVTEERGESVLFSEPNYSGGTVLAVLKAEEPAQAAAVSDNEEETFWDGIKDSFHKTFLREDRWKLFAEGVLTTLLITVLAVLFGTILGFALFMLCRNGNVLANGSARFSMWMVQGTPMVVLLMILYYVIFGSVAISGIAVAVIGFTLTFGAAVFGMLKMGVGAVDKGQYEAAYALGHSNRHTFFRIILPQAIPHVLPAFQGEIVGLIKATAIVGYIAVQDLTKMGDIVRSRTYEAFFPLIAITVIYFVLEGLLSFAVSRIRVKIDPKKRKRETILKGVNIHD